MSPSSRESNLQQYREALLHTNTQIFLLIAERRALSVKIQGMKESSGRYSYFDPEREKAIFEQLKEQMKGMTIKELLGFSLIMEDQAMAMAPGSYPVWSSGVHLLEATRETYTMINPILLKITHPDLFNRLSFSSDFGFLKQF